MRPQRFTFPVLRLLFIAFIALPINDALAWGNLGHRVTGLVAQDFLSAQARREVESLLGDETLADAATYMDTHRDELKDRWPESPRWHYDNRSVCNQSSYCRDGDCATQQIEHFRRVLADKTASRNDRKMALRLLIHMMGDIHQPLHMADNHDRGGNDVWVRVYAGAERKNLHYVFDTELVRDSIDHRRDYNYARDLIATYRGDIPRWQRGDVASWANESFLTGKQDVYAELPQFSCGAWNNNRTITLSPAYMQRARKDVEVQLVKAGVRIAAVLNTTLLSKY